MNTPRHPICSKCGLPLPADAPKGLCPRCLASMNLATETAFTGADAVASQTPLTPDELAPHFPQLEILDCLGRGGMGVVYKARQKSLNRFVALKLLAPERAKDPSFAERFAKEAQALAVLNHPHIVGVYDFGQAGGFYFLLMEFVDGVNLRQAMKAGRFTPEQALAVVPPVCEALQYAHEHGIVHRDIKPENLLLDKAGRVKIADFGIAKMLHANGSDTGLADSQPAGTPQYMAPEQKMHGRTDHRADIYSLGVVLYELLTGEMPGANLQPPSHKVQIDVRLDEIVLRALEKKPELRYQTAGEMRTQVETFTSSPRSSRGNEAPTEGKDQSLLTSAATGPRFLKIGTSTLLTPGQLATFSGQLLGYRTRGQLVLDDCQLTHTAPPALVSAVTVIPLAAIRDVSIGKYPRIMNPLGIDLLSVTYEEGGERKQVLLSPMEGYFAFPRTWDARVAEWAIAIREAATAASGRAPTTTPSEKLGVPGSHLGLLTMFLMPLVPLGVFMGVLTTLSSPGSLSNRSGLLSLFAFGMAVFAFVLLFLQKRRMKSSPGSVASHLPLRIWFGVTALIAVLAAWKLFVPSSGTSGVTQFKIEHVGVSNNVVIVDVTTEVGRGHAELRAVLDGPPLPAANEAALADTFFPPFAGTFIKPTPFAGNHPWRILGGGGGRQTWRLGFVLPDATLAKYAFETLRPIGSLPAVPDRTFSVTLFEVRQTNDQRFRASLQVALPLTSSDPDWVSVFGQSQRNETAVTLNWDVLASQSGLAQFSRAGSPILVLRPDPQTRLFGVTAGLELVKVGTNRVQFVRRIGGDPIREELPGDFRELADELLRTATFSAKATSGTQIELCRFQGKPFTVQVHVTDSPGAYRLKVVMVVGLGVVVMLIAGAVLLVLVRKGRSVGKAGLVVLGLLLLIGSMAVVALIGYRAKTAARLDQSAPVTSEAKRIAATGGRLALFSPIVGEGIGTNVFRSVTTIAQPQHVAVWTLEVKTDQDWSLLPELDLWALAWNNSAPFPVVAEWNADSRTNGRAGLELTVEAQGRRRSSRPSGQDWLNDYSWRATPGDRSYWVSPSEWNLNEANSLPIFEGVKRSDPNARATIRLTFSLFALPSGFVPTLQSNVVHLGQNWRSSLGLPGDFPTTIALESSIGGPTTTTEVGTVQVATRAPWIAILLAVLLFFGVAGGGVVLLVVLFRKRSSTTAKVLAVLGSAALLLFLIVVGLIVVYWNVRRDTANQAAAAERQAAMTEMQKLRYQAADRANRMAPPPLLGGPTAGLGVALSARNGRFVIGSIVPNTPAARDGRLQPGEQVLAVEEQMREVVYLDGMKLTDVVRLLRGEAGSIVTLHVQPSGQALGEPVRIELVREHLATLEAEAEGQLLTSPPKEVASGRRTFPLRHRLGSEMAEELLRTVVAERLGNSVKYSEDNQSVIVAASPDIMTRAHTFINVTDWPDRMQNLDGPTYLTDTVLRSARSWFHACAVDSSVETLTSLLSLHVLAELRGDTRSERYRHYMTGGVPDAAWERELRGDWQGKKEAMQRLVREWNSYPLKRITGQPGVAMGFGVKHFCSVSFEGAPKEFFDITIEPDRIDQNASRPPTYRFGSLPPWWKQDESTKK